MKCSYSMNLNLTRNWSSHKMIRNDISNRIKYSFIFFMSSLVLVPLVIPDSAFALQVISGNQISIQEPIQDDVVIFGETVYVDAPVRGAMIFANIINVNAPIEGDLTAAGREVTVNADISGKIVAAGNTIDLAGKSTNVLLAANNVHFYPTSVIIRDAYVAGGTINNEGIISGKLVAMTDNFQNNGTIGDIEISSQESMMPDVEGWLSLFGILFVIGFAVLGVILVKLLPNQFESVRLVMKKSIIKNTVVGFLLIILFVVVIVLSAITVVGLPVSAFGLLVLLIGLILSSLMVSYVIGKKILELLGRKSTGGDGHNIISFLIGFAILNLLYIVPIPYFSQIAQVIVTSIGFGAICYTVHKSRSPISNDKVTI
jgi:cytoskeletal protein CcmA (bactofilin family)